MFLDAGFDNFGPSYEEWCDADTLMISARVRVQCESMTILFTDWIMRSYTGCRIGRRNNLQQAIGYTEKDIIVGSTVDEIGALQQIEDKLS